LHEDGDYKSANNRAYYAIFSSIRAVLALDGVDFKKHSGVIQYFQRTYVKTGIFDKAYSDIVMSASIIRNASDYDDFYIASRAESQEQIENAQLLYKQITEYIDKRLNDNNTGE